MRRHPRHPLPEGTLDAVIIGSGFGGLGAALGLAERGARVALVETLRYPGGCASTFTHKKARYEAGATLFSGFGEGHLFDRWRKAHQLDIAFHELDPVVELRSEHGELAISPNREKFLTRFADSVGAAGPRLRAFFAEQERVAEALWSLFRDTELLPPFTARSLFAHVRRAPQYLPVLRWVGRPLEAVMKKHGVAELPALRLFVDAVSQITVQASAAEAEAPFALASMDYYFRGTGHVDGGVGQLAWAMVEAIERASGIVYMSNRAEHATRTGDVWKVSTRRGELRARNLICNTLPRATTHLVSGDRRGVLRKLGEQLDDAWGAVMLYAQLEESGEGLPDSSRHFELVADSRAPFVEGNHVFCSLGTSPHGGGPRTMTISTHVPIREHRARSDEERAAHIAEVQSRMWKTVELRAPELSANTRSMITASPRTFERFTGRPDGCVGGIPRRVGLGNYAAFGPVEFERDAYLVGDTVFPGQSTLGTALGGERLAAHLT